LANLDTYNEETRNAFEGTLAWLYQWACARTYGLGSKLPWDHTFMVESLSDSTIYMSYYTIAHLLHADVEGAKPGPLGVTAEQLTDEVWDYILGSGDLPVSAGIKPEAAQALRHSFRYWYPLDIRSSGKDLINNHLTFCIYVHAALFPEEHWPKSIRTNGHLMLNGKKMSKSTGNFLTMKDSVKKFGADATRLSLADAGDGLDDANFDEKNANASILRLHTLIEWCEVSA
jgi:leucyl-tRNA synthetase